MEILLVFQGFSDSLRALEIRFKLLAIMTLYIVHGYCKIRGKYTDKQKALKSRLKKPLIPYENPLFNWGQVSDAHHSHPLAIPVVVDIFRFVWGPGSGSSVGSSLSIRALLSR